MLCYDLDGPELGKPVSNFFTAVQGDRVTLICGTNLQGNPEPQVEWFSNMGANIALSNESFSISNGPDIVSLTLFQASVIHTGTWSCVVMLSAPNGTIIRQIQRNFSVTILGKNAHVI